MYTDDLSLKYKSIVYVLIYRLEIYNMVYILILYAYMLEMYNMVYILIFYASNVDWYVHFDLKYTLDIFSK